MKYDVAVIGGSLGGVQAAISAAKMGRRVYLCEETDWVGGQLTSQAVPPDEHRWIEEFGATGRYLDYRRAVRDHYRGLAAFRREVAEKKEFCPGNSWVSRVAHEPLTALNLLNKMMEEYIRAGVMEIDYHTVACESEEEGNRIRSVTVKNTVTGKEKKIEAIFFLDATDCGDLLPIVGAEYSMGAEGREETGEIHAAEEADPEDMQPVTHVAALELDPDGDYRIGKPAEYDYFSRLGVPYDDNKLLSWYSPDCISKKKVKMSMFDGELKEKPLGLWSYRRIIDTANYTDGRKQVSLLNWPQNDYALGAVFGCADAAHHLAMARAQTLCTVYWLQNEAPRADGGKGYAVGLRPDIMGTQDGLAKAAYIRESRRIVAKRTIREQDVSKAANPAPAVMEDSVGVGHYAIDIHMTTKSHSFYFDETWPFEIPLSAMVPVRLLNLIPACKNIGCTHLTAGCYRLHPVEWNIGEVAGYLAAYCIEHKQMPAEILEREHMREFQKLLVKERIQLHWDFSKMGGIG